VASQLNKKVTLLYPTSNPSFTLLVPAKLEAKSLDTLKLLRRIGDTQTHLKHNRPTHRRQEVLERLKTLIIYELEMTI
jgi:hypothetical protein